MDEITIGIVGIVASLIGALIGASLPELWKAKEREQKRTAVLTTFALDATYRQYSINFVLSRLSSEEADYLDDAKFISVARLRPELETTILENHLSLIAEYLSQKEIGALQIYYHALKVLVSEQPKISESYENLPGEDEVMDIAHRAGVWTGVSAWKAYAKAATDAYVEIVAYTNDKGARIQGASSPEEIRLRRLKLSKEKERLTATNSQEL